VLLFTLNLANAGVPAATSFNGGFVAHSGPHKSYVQRLIDARTKHIAITRPVKVKRKKIKVKVHRPARVHDEEDDEEAILALFA
jgi:hypothetical protein